MIITGFPGIGKSTLARKDLKYIDLESTNFWKVENDQKSRPDDWFIYYSQIAVDLSKQGYIVFVSSHSVVRKYLSTHHEDEEFYVIFPSLNLNDEWINRVKVRYENSLLEKDLRALMSVRDNYEINVNELYEECQCNYYTNTYIIEDINYDLKECIDSLIRR